MSNMEVPSPRVHWVGSPKSLTYDSDLPEISQKDREDFESKWTDSVVKLHTKIDGKDRVKALDSLVLICRSLKRDLRNIIKHNHSVQELSVDFFVKVTRSSLVHRSSYIRAAAIRLIRYVIGCVNISDTFWKYHCHYLLSPMFFVDKRQDKEKRQMIELMRQISTRMYDAEHVPLLLVKCLVSIAENPEDTYMASTTEILRDLLVKNPEVVSKASGTKALLHAVINPKFKDISESIVLSFLYLLDDAKMRRYVREGELQTIFGPLTQESYAEDKKEQKAQWEASRRAICVMMKSWPGLIVISRSGLNAIVNALRINHEERQQILLDILIDILKNASPQQFHSIIPRLSTEDRNSNNPFLHLNVYTNATLLQLQQQQQPTILNQPQEDNILLVFLAATILSLLRNGVIESLTQLSKGSGTTADRAGQIVQVVLVFCDKLLLSDRCLEMHDRIDSEISQSLRDQSFMKTLSSLTTNYRQSARTLRSSSQSSSAKILLNLSQVKTQVDSQMDDSSFHQLIKDSNVLVTKDDKKWVWDKIQTLVYGPLRIPNRLQEALKTEFPKRLISYYKPHKRLFSDLNYQESYQHLAMLASQMIDNLLSIEEGRMFLKRCGLMEQLHQVLQAELSITSPAVNNQGSTINNNNSNNSNNSNNILSEERVTYKMSREYFALLGKFTQHVQGVIILEEFNIFSLLVSLTTKRDDICQLIIKNLEYTHTFNQASRLILKEAMISGSRKIRYFSTLRLRKLVRDCVDFDEWGIELLNVKLTDEWEDVSKHALRILAEACTNNIRNLDALIQLGPDVTALEKHADGRYLLLRMVGRDEGLQYLISNGWIQHSMKDWRQDKNLDYVSKIEHSLHKAMTAVIIKRTGLSFSIVSDEGVNLPPHFYGELCRTKQGCELLMNGGDFDFLKKELENANVVRTRHVVQYADDDRIDLSGMNDVQWIQLYKRGILWAFAHIASSDVGFEFINPHYPILNFIQLAEKSQNLSMRGSGLYMLSVVAKSTDAKSQLENHGWEIHHDLGTNICVPGDCGLFFQIGDYSFVGSSADGSDPFTQSEQKLAHDDLHPDIVKNMEALSNPVTEMSSLKALAKIKATNPDDLNASVLFYAFYLLTRYRYSLKSKKFMFSELFNHIVLTDIDFEYLDATYGCFK